MTEPDRCPLHDSILEEGIVRCWKAGEMGDPIIAELEVRAAKFPWANEYTFALDGPEYASVRFCATCREVRRAWAAAPFSWNHKQRLMQAGFDPYIGYWPAVPMAILVTDYVWLERGIRAAADAQILYFLPTAPRQGESLDDFIIRQTTQARDERAPLDVVFRGKNGWVALGELDDNDLRDAMGLPPWPELAWAELV